MCLFPRFLWIRGPNVLILGEWMSGSFEELGISAQLAANAASVGYDTPTEVQRTTIPVMRRGNNAIVTATPGAGATAAYALALLDRFADADSPRALVLAPNAAPLS